MCDHERAAGGRPALEVTMLSFPDVSELSDEVRRIFEELDRLHHLAGSNLSGVHTPPIDVLETDATVEVRIDLPGVTPDDVRILFKDSALLVAGEKLQPEACPAQDAAFHLVERGFGRFARVVRLSIAVDASRASATLHNGELRLSVPIIPERRGNEIPVPVRRVPR